jgi:uncharacterized protein YggU (UPF0235/DUF167 family)
LKLEIHVRPNASRTEVGGIHDGTLVVRVAQAPSEGRATDAALDAVARALGLPRNAVALVHGATSRRKLLELDVAAGPVIEARIGQLLGGPDYA